MTTRRARLAVAVTSLGVVAALAPASAGAAATASTADEPAAEHCVASTTTSATACFDTLDEALAFASDGRVDTAPDGRAALRRDVAASNAQADETKGDVIGAVLFTGSDYAGDSLTLTIGAPCVKDGWMDWEAPLNDPWKGTVSSATVWAGCSLWLYPESGNRHGPYDDDTPALGPANDVAHLAGLS